MARPLRLEFPGAFYHVMSRGNGKQDIFLEDSDKLAFLDILSSVIESCNWTFHSYCLMRNHYHLLIETPQPNLSKGMRNLNGIYSQAFNRKYDKVGHVMQGRFLSPIVVGDSYFLESVRYIVLNPVRNKLTSQPSDWRWSSFRAMAGLTARPVFLETERVLDLFSEDIATAQWEFQRFILEGVDDPSPSAIRNTLIGDVPVPNAVSSALSAKRMVRDIPRDQRYCDRSSLHEIFRGSRGKRERNSAVIVAHYENGYSMTEIAEYLGINCSTVSRVLRSNSLEV